MPEAERFGLQRKIISTMTSDGWRHAPHASFLLELDVTPLTEFLKEVNTGRGLRQQITLNTAMLKLIAEGIKVCPRMNGHVRFGERLVRGTVTYYDQIDVTMPFLLDSTTTMTLNLRGLEGMRMTEIRDAVADLIRRAKNTHLPQVMYEVAMRDTWKEFKRLHIGKVAGRLLGALLDGSTREVLRGRKKREYLKIPETDRLTWRDLEQGTITVSNPGMLFKDMRGDCVMLQIVPPQLVAIAINMVRNQPVVRRDGSIGAAKVMTLTIAFDHRVLDAVDFVSFCRRVKKLAASPELLRELV